MTNIVKPNPTKVTSPFTGEEFTIPQYVTIDPNKVQQVALTRSPEALDIPFGHQLSFGFELAGFEANEQPFVQLCNLVDNRVFSGGPVLMRAQDGKYVFTANFNNDEQADRILGVYAVVKAVINGLEETVYVSDVCWMKLKANVVANEMKLFSFIQDAGHTLREFNSLYKELKTIANLPNFAAQTEKHAGFELLMVVLGQWTRRQVSGYFDWSSAIDENVRTAVTLNSDFDISIRLDWMFFYREGMRIDTRLCFEMCDNQVTVYSTVNNASTTHLIASNIDDKTIYDGLKAAPVFVMSPEQMADYDQNN